MSNIFMLFSEDSVFQEVFQTVADIQALQSHRWGSVLPEIETAKLVLHNAAEFSWCFECSLCCSHRDIFWVGVTKGVFCIVIVLCFVTENKADIF